VKAFLKKEAPIIAGCIAYSLLWTAFGYWAVAVRDSENALKTVVFVSGFTGTAIGAGYALWKAFKVLG